MWAASTSDTPATRRRSSPRRQKPPSCTSPPGFPNRKTKRSSCPPIPPSGASGICGEKSGPQQGLQCALSVAASAEEGRAEIRGHPARLPPPGGRPGGLCQGKHRRLGDLGSLFCLGG